MYAAGMTIMAVSVGEICENTKLAREMALTGNYESALVYYEGTIQMIHRLLVTIADPTRKSKWQLVSLSFFPFQIQSFRSEQLNVVCLEVGDITFYDKQC